MQCCRSRRCARHPDLRYGDRHVHSGQLHARFTRLHNNANVLCLGARVTGVELALAIVDTFLSTEFEGGRHQRRIDLLNA